MGNEDVLLSELVRGVYRSFLKMLIVWLTLRDYTYIFVVFQKTWIHMIRSCIYFYRSCYILKRIKYFGLNVYLVYYIISFLDSSVKFYFYISRRLLRAVSAHVNQILVILDTVWTITVKRCWKRNHVINSASRVEFSVPFITSALDNDSFRIAVAFHFWRAQIISLDDTRCNII